MTTIDMGILVLMTLAAMWTVMTRSLLRSAIGLALTSALLTIAMFRLRSPLAAVFELSVCSGLISVIFIATISLTHPMTQEKVLQHMKDRLSRFWYLAILVIAVAGALLLIKPAANIPALLAPVEKDVRFVLWAQRPLDLLGQILMLLTGSFGIIILFREVRK